MEINCSSTGLLRSISVEVLVELGQHLREAICVRDLNGCAIYANAAWHSKFPLALPASLIEKSLSISRSELRDSSGQVVAELLVADDRAPGSQLLDQKTEFLNAVFQATPECIKISDAAGCIVDINAYGLSMTEANSLEDLVGKCVFDLVVPEDRERFIASHQRVCAGHSETIEYGSFTLSGKRLACESHAVPIEFNNQRMHLSITRDITEREQTEKDLYHLWQNAIDPLCIASSSGYFLKVNPAWTKALGWSEAELTSRPWLDFVHPDDRDSTIEAGATLLAGSPVANFENRYLCKDGSFRWFSWSTIPLANSHINYGFVRDITEIRRLSEQFHQAQKLEAIGRLPAVSLMTSIIC